MSGSNAPPYTTLTSDEAPGDQTDSAYEDGRSVASQSTVSGKSPTNQHEEGKSNEETSVNIENEVETSCQPEMRDDSKNDEDAPDRNSVYSPSTDYAQDLRNSYLVVLADGEGTDETEGPTSSTRLDSDYASVRNSQMDSSRTASTLVNSDWDPESTLGGRSKRTSGDYASMRSSQVIGRYKLVFVNTVKPSLQLNLNLCRRNSQWQLFFSKFSKLVKNRRPETRCNTIRQRIHLCDQFLNAARFFSQSQKAVEIPFF